MFWQKTQARQQAARKAADEKDESKPRHLCLTLSNFALSLSFDGWEYDDAEPHHRVAVGAKWRHRNYIRSHDRSDCLPSGRTAKS
jgi:hypothetical protein